MPMRKCREEIHSDSSSNEATFFLGHFISLRISYLFESLVSLYRLGNTEHLNHSSWFAYGDDSDLWETESKLFGNENFFSSNAMSF